MGQGSNFSAHSWLKANRPKHRIYPHQQDYCDTCAQKKDSLNAKQTVLNRIRQTGSSTEEEQKQIKAEITAIQSELDHHRETAQKSHEYHPTVTKRCAKDWKEILELEKLAENRSTEDSEKLLQLKHSFTLTVSVDYQMSKLIPYWGYSAQPGSTYYLRKLSNDIFGIIDHREEKAAIYLVDETVGPKNTDHTVSYITHYLKSDPIPDFVRRVHIFLDNTCSTRTTISFDGQWNLLNLAYWTTSVYPL